MSVVAYKCPSCGAEIAFAPQLQHLKCEYCLSEFTVQELEEFNAKSASGAQVDQGDAEPNRQADEDFTAHAVAYSCPSCGAQIITDENTAATFCCYCHNPVVLSDRLTGVLRPNKAIPFRYTKEDAMNALTTFCKKKWFAPKAFLREAIQEKITGIYIPFWLTDCNVDGRLSANANKIRTWRSGQYRYTETKVYEVQRAGSISLQNIAHAALKKLDTQLIGSIAPYDFTKMQDFSMAYLSGFFAEKYDMDKEVFLPSIQEMARNYSRQALYATVKGYDTVSVTDADAEISRINWEYVLLPVWMLHYEYKKKKYYFAMNGQTGKLFGLLPVCLGKLAILFGVVSVAITAFMLIGGMLL